MKTLYLLLSILFVQACHPVEPIAYDPLSELKKQEGHFEICDVVARSDGGTVSLCLLLDSGTLWLTNRTDKKAHWSAVYETKDGFAPPPYLSPTTMLNYCCAAGYKRVTHALQYWRFTELDSLLKAPMT